MNRDEFDHAVRAAGAILGEQEILVIGSQSIHGSIAKDLPIEATRSVQVDIAAMADPDDRKADLIDGSIGEASMFHDSFGFYAQGVSQTTAVLAPGWQDRLVRYESPSTNGVVAWCLEIHDLWLSKAVAEREKDSDFCTALLRLGLVEPATLVERANALPDIGPARLERVKALAGSA